MAESKISANGWVRLALTRSNSDPSKMYVIGIRLLKTGKVEMGCDCPSRIYHKGTKAHAEFDCTCKHARAFIDGTISASDLDLTPEGAEWILARHAAMKTAAAAANKDILAAAQAVRAAAQAAAKTEHKASA